MGGKQIFFSYADKDYSPYKIVQTSAQLTEIGRGLIGYIYYWEREKSKYSSIRAYEEDGISKSNAVVVFFAERTKNTGGVVDELEIARAKNKLIIPVFPAGHPEEIWDEELRGKGVIGVAFGKDSNKFVDDLLLNIINKGEQENPLT